MQSVRCWSCCWWRGTAGWSSLWEPPARLERPTLSSGMKSITRRSSAPTWQDTATPIRATWTTSWKSWGHKVSLRKTVWGTERMKLTRHCAKLRSRGQMLEATRAWRLCSEIENPVLKKLEELGTVTNSFRSVMMKKALKQTVTHFSFWASLTDLDHEEKMGTN